MALTQEREKLLAQREVILSNTFRDILSRVPETVDFAQTEAREMKIATTPEGKFALTYLLSARDLLKPALEDLTNISPDLLVPRGGSQHNPERNIDKVGTNIALEVMERTKDFPHTWMRTEESADWENISRDDAGPHEGIRFIIVDPLDMTSAIPRLNRVQTTGIAIYDKAGTLQSLGIMSLVNSDMVFIENREGNLSVYPAPIPGKDTDSQGLLRVAAKIRRMHSLNNLPLFQSGAKWAMDCDSGFATLGLLNNTVDTVVDHEKGSVWYEVAIWGRAAQALGFPVSDKEGNTLDIEQDVKKMIQKHEGDTFRIPFVMSRTPAIHARVLELLKSSKNSS